MISKFSNALKKIIMMSNSKTDAVFAEEIAQYQKFNDQNLFRIIRETNRQMSNSLNKKLENYGITDLSARHIQIFDYLEAEGTNIVTLAQRAGITKQAMSKMVKEVAQADYVCLTTNAKDNRLVIVKFTKKGITFLYNFRTELLKARELVLKVSNMSDECHKEMAKNLTCLSNNLQVIK